MALVITCLEDYEVPEYYMVGLVQCVVPKILAWVVPDMLIWCLRTGNVTYPVNCEVPE